MELWLTTLVWAIIAVALIVVIGRRGNIERLRQMPWYRLPLIAGVLWGGFAVVLIWGYWKDYYSYFIPPYVKWFAPAAALTYFVIAHGLRWLALRLPGNPIINFCLLGGVESIPEHALGIYGFHILEIPILKDMSATSIFIFAFFEYIVYWAVVVGVALLVDKFWIKRAQL
jgi:hypothetical protein